MIDIIIVQRAAYEASSDGDPIIDGGIIADFRYWEGRMVVKIQDLGGAAFDFFFCAARESQLGFKELEEIITLFLPQRKFLSSR